MTQKKPSLSLVYVQVLKHRKERQKSLKIVILLRAQKAVLAQRNRALEGNWIRLKYYESLTATIFSLMLMVLPILFSPVSLGHLSKSNSSFKIIIFTSWLLQEPSFNFFTSMRKVYLFLYISSLHISFTVQ